MTNDPIIISIGGGKGGIGKSTITSNVGTALLQKNYNVGFIDADLGGANLHHCLGIQRPSKGLRDYLTGKIKELNDIAIPTPMGNSWLISGASDIVELANPRFSQKKKIIRNLSKMNADYILVDLGAGTGTNVTDFFAAFPYGIVVTDGSAASIENAYGFLKNGIIRGLVRLFPGNKEVQKFIHRSSTSTEGESYATIKEMISAATLRFPAETRLMKEYLHSKRIFLILNMVRDSSDVARGRRFIEIVKKYLSLKMLYIGYIVYSKDVNTSFREMRPIMQGTNAKEIRNAFTSITTNLIALTQG
ncbi:MAG: P-loop NTPase [Chitinivibrionales bacterium]|nr:P-loop NTPase [Chitinivibrionales bacterium]